MGTTLSNLKPPAGAKHRRMRVGRGPGSGKGKTCGRGVKGQKSRAGHHGARMGFEGGQMPLQRRMPKRGFKNIFRRDVTVVNVGALAKRFDGGEVTPDRLREAGMMPRSAELVKILAEGEIGHALTVRAHAFSTAARDKIIKAGGQVEVLPRRPTPSRPAPEA